MEPMIQFTDVWFQYPSGESAAQRPALKGINLTIETGEYVSIVGLNGSGKSTLARLINGLFLPTKGEVKVAGMSTVNEEALWEIRRRVGMVFQNPDNQIVATTVEDDVAFGLENIGIPRNEMKSRIQEALSLVGLRGFEWREPHTLSGGQKQRLAIAGVLAMSPDVIVFDESTSMLDPQGRESVCQVIGQLHRRGKTVIHITHSAHEAFLADRVIVMDQGAIQLDLPADELYSQSMLLKNWGLDVPIAVELHHRLVKRGWPLPPVITSEEELVQELWKLLSKT